MRSREHRVLRSGLAIAIAIGGPFAATRARADLRDVALRVENEWTRAGAEVTRAPARFLYDDETMSVVVPEAPEQGCTTVAIIGARGISFHAKVNGAVEDPFAEEGGRRAASVAGLLSIERCSGEPLRAIAVTSDAGRGAIETVVARSKVPLKPLRAILPERTGGILPPTPEPGAMPALPAQEKRVETAETRARRDGGSIEARTELAAGVDGTGDGHLALGAGCHRIELFAPTLRADLVARKFRIDVDAELRDEDSDELLARDRTDAADARLDACVGRATATRIVFAGALPATKLTTTHASWPIPPLLPSTWGDAARGKMAAALRARSLVAPASSPILLTQGGSGITPVPVDVEAGGCYVAVAVVTHGHARGLGLRARTFGRETVDERSANDDSGAIAFCVKATEHARVDVDARGTALAWAMALYRVQSGVWGDR